MIITGKAYWAKILKPTQNYSKDGEEYTIDVTVTDKSRAALEEAGLGDKIRAAVNPNNGREHASGEDYIKISVPTTTRNGDPLRAPQVKDKFGNAWPDDVLVGNGSLVDVMFLAREWTMGARSGVKPSLKGVRVVEHVAVEPSEDFEYADAPSAEEVWTDE